MESLFPLGQTVITPGARDTLCEMYGAMHGHIQIARLLHRHRTGDDGDLEAADKLANLRALAEDTRIFSAYNLTPADGGDPVRFWVITEWDRSYTTILLPSEY